MECVWLIAGLQPHLAQVILIRLWGWVGLHTCGAWAIMAPRINQLSPHRHSGERATVMAACTICSAATNLPFPINRFLFKYLPVSCVGGPQQKPLMWHVQSLLLQTITIVYTRHKHSNANQFILITLYIYTYDISRLTHHCDLYVKAGMPSLSIRRYTHWMTLIYKTLLGLVPTYLCFLLLVFNCCLSVLSLWHMLLPFLARSPLEKRLDLNGFLSG